MSFSELFFLSLIQGITEFLPISSSAHLILFTEYFGSSKQSITVDVFAHFGTLIAVPSSLPFKLGNTKLIAFAAPVEVGIIASPAALARRKSL